MALRNYLILILVLLSAIVALAERSVSFAEPSDESANFQQETLLDGLDNPTGVTLRQARDKNAPPEIIFAESGAGRVMRLSTDSALQAKEVIVNFPTGKFGEQPSYRVGPLGMGFISRTKFVVCVTGEQPSADIVAGFTLPTSDVVLNAKDRDHIVGPLETSSNSANGGLQFRAVAATNRTCFFSAGTEAGSEGWILKSGIQANRLAYLQTFIDARKTGKVGNPGGIAIIPEPRPSFLVVGLMGSRETPSDSRLKFFVPSTGELALDLPTGLQDIIALAYSPSGQLYAADFSWNDEQAGGIFRIDDARVNGRQTCQAVKIASLVHPFGLAFAPDGTLYATSFGPGENEKQGTLTKITGEL